MRDRNHGVYTPPLRGEPGFGPVAGTAAEDGGRGPLLLGVTLAVLFALIGVIWSSYNQGIREGGRDAPPRILASADPIKVTPEDPGGRETDYLDMRVFDVLEDEAPASLDEDAAAEDADPMPGSALNDLLASETAPAAPAASGAEDAADDAADDAGAGAGVETPTDFAAAETGPRLKPLPRSPEAGDLGAAHAGRPLTLADAGGAAAAPVIETPTIEAAPEPDAETETGAATDARAATPSPNAAAAAAAASAAGDFLVQIASFRSETAADQGWSAFEADFADVLAGLHRDVARADLGDRGVRFRVRVGAFDDRETASTFCDRLKARGQECLVVGS